MNEGRPSDGPSRTWLDRISQVLSGEPRDREQLIEILRDAQERNLLDAEALTMIEGVLQVSEMQVRDIMIPRSQMVIVERDQQPEEFLPEVIKSAHSRFPVIADDRDDVVGILLAKDLLAYSAGVDQIKFNMRDILRPAVFIPESKRLNVLLKEFRANRNHMAIVVDEYGGVAGLVTIEDVLEQIVGEIADEHDFDEDTYIKQLSDTRFTIKALTPIEDFNEHFSVNFSDEEFDTIGGLILNEFKRVPKRGETVVINNFRFKILNADNRRIHLLEGKVLPVEQTAVEEIARSGGA
ncbi:MAG: CBS domain-containing protein [Gammaproteobacteria bacterium]|nr:CBS domain-containing protein [Gammaproteobacteria bacterium]